MGMMDKLGFEGDPAKWAGKTIELAEVMKTAWGSVSDYCVMIRFTDGSRGWTIGRNSNGLVIGPDVDSLAKSKIITPEEYGSMVAQRKRENDAREAEEVRRRKAEFDRMKKEFGE